MGMSVTSVVPSLRDPVRNSTGQLVATALALDFGAFLLKGETRGELSSDTDTLGHYS